MKKILSLTLVLAMVMSMGITTAFAAGNWEGGTTVTYSATGAEEWTVTVPAALAPGASGTVTLSGSWANNKTVKVTADATVTLINSIDNADQKVLAVTFPSIELAGSNTAAVTDTQVVSVAEMPADALFGTWSGRFNYNVEMVEVVNLKTIDIYITDTDTVYKTIQYKDGMTWADWVASDYNTNDDFGYDDSDGYVWNKTVDYPCFLFDESIDDFASGHELIIENHRYHLSIQ